MSAVRNYSLSFGFMVVTNNLFELGMWNFVQRYIKRSPTLHVPTVANMATV